MTAPIGYQFEADTYCPACTADRFAVPPRTSPDQPLQDAFGIPADATDREGNPVHPVFDTDEWCEPTERGQQTLVCSVLTCGALLATCEHEPEDCTCDNCLAAEAFTPEVTS